MGMTTSTDHDAQPVQAGPFEVLPEGGAAQIEQAQARAVCERSPGAARRLELNGWRVGLRASHLESLLPEDHRARPVWGYVEHQDPSKLFEAI